MSPLGALPKATRAPRGTGLAPTESAGSASETMVGTGGGRIQRQLVVR